MGYRIEYSQGNAVWTTERIRWGRILLYSCFCFLFFCALASYFRPEVGDVLQSWLYPGNAAVTKAALRHMTEQLQAGEELSEAVYVFCQEILDGANHPG